MTIVERYSLTIDGVAIDTEEGLEVCNPAIGKSFAHAPKAGKKELDAAVAAAQVALPGWRARTWADRAAVIGKMADVIDAHADELASLFVAEQGRPLPMAKAEIMGAAFWMRAVAAQELHDEVTEEDDTKRVVVRHRPLGVVAAIVPWNFPLLLAAWKIAPALLTGNTMVLKPSPFTPLCTLWLGELWREVVPPGVLNVISGDNDLGPMMTAHPGFAKISFTGSTATGKRVMESASRDLKRITLELGGNDACIVMPDVDVEKVAPRLFHGAFHNSAQVCVATKRMYIHEDIYDQMRDALHRLAMEAVVGDGAQQGVQYGPIQNRAQFERVCSLIEDARNSGLALLQGRAVPESGGYFVPITLVDNPPDDAPVVTQEAFGPVLPLLRFTDVDDVIARANDTIYGLAGAVWSRDIECAVNIASRLETGTVWINDNLSSSPSTPLAGAKQSGFGVENGIDGLKEYTAPQVIHIPKTTGDV